MLKTKKNTLLSIHIMELLENNGFIEKKDKKKSFRKKLTNYNE